MSSRPPLLTALAVVLAVETLGLAAVLLLLVVEIAGAGRGVDIGSAIALAVLTAVGVVLLGALTAGAWRSRPWILAAGIVCQLITLFVGLAAFQGAGSQPVLGAAVTLPAIAGLVLLFTPAVRDALRRPDRTG